MSELKSVKALASPANIRGKSAAFTSENSNSFSILTKEFLNQPDDTAGAAGNRNAAAASNSNPNNSRNLSPYPVIRINGVDVNNLSENDDSGEQPQGYVYDKPKIPFEAEDRESTNIQSTTVVPQR